MTLYASEEEANAARFAKLREAVERVEHEMRELRLPIQDDIPDDLRYKLMVCACSLNDYLLWVEKLDEQGEYGERWRCNEIETGCHKDGDHAAEAVYNYFGWKPSAGDQTEAEPESVTETEPHLGPG